MNFLNNPANKRKQKISTLYMFTCIILMQKAITLFI